MKRVREIIALLCALAMLVPTCTFGADGGSSSTEMTTASGQECICFGSYPQSEVVNDAKVSGVYGKTWSRADDYIVDADLYSKLQAATWDENDDVTVEEDKYHRIKKSDATFSSNGKSDHYYTWSDSTTYHYFKYEPIRWRVLENDGANAYLLSEIVIDDQRYNSSWLSTTWETSGLRSWLNSTFLTRAFTKAEQGVIKTKTVENKDNMTYGASGGNDTKDKVYLLSESEVYTDDATKYGFDSRYYASDKARQSESSTYAKAMGVYTENDSDYPGNCCWWLRSPGYDNSYAACVFVEGYVISKGYNVGYENNGTRPALHVDLESPNNQIIPSAKTIKGIKSIKPGKKKLTVKWTKASKTYLKQISGYEICCSTDKSFKPSKTKTVTVKGTKSTSRTITGLKSKQKYYVKMRSYKTVDEQKYYSTWSKVKTGKTK